MKARKFRGLQNFAEILQRQLAQHQLTLDEVNRRLGWPDGALQARLADSEGGLRIDQLREVLGAAGLSEQAFFAELYDLEPRRNRRREEIPYSTGLLSDQDSADFPPSSEVLGMFRLLVQEGLRSPRDMATGSVSGDDFPEDRPPKGGPLKRRSS